ncbi:hypothetical protein P12x_004868 [Tundrisphaera lichenicola]|uniref:hypothetical protein n=1 Tax=Tundrisphaera lichenicola TaxID=2029860 RepID=UPI003EBC4416
MEQQPHSTRGFPTQQDSGFDRAGSGEQAEAIADADNVPTSTTKVLSRVRNVGRRWAIIRDNSLEMV